MKIASVNPSELLSQIQELQLALAHVMMRDHEHKDYCSGCENAMRLHNEYIKGD